MTGRIDALTLAPATGRDGHRIDAGAIEACVSGTLASAARSELESHLSRCAECRALLVGSFRLSRWGHRTILRKRRTAAWSAYLAELFSSFLRVARALFESPIPVDSVACERRERSWGGPAGTAWDPLRSGVVRSDSWDRLELRPVG